MKETFEFNNPKKIIQATIWCLLIGIFIVVSHIESTPSREVLREVEEPNYTTVSSFDMMDYFERKAYERLLQNYQLRVMRTILISCVGLFGLYQLFRNRKLVVSDDGIAVYSIYSPKAYESFEWKAIEHIHIGNAKALNGLLGDVGIYIDSQNRYDSKETTFISLKYIEDRSLVIKHIEDLNSATLTVSSDMNQRSSSSDSDAKAILLQGINTYKKNYKSLFLYSLIIFVFAFLQRIFLRTSVGLLGSAANIYFAYHALIALNYYLFKKYRAEDITFDDSWKYAKKQFQRFFGAELIKGIIIIVIVAGIVLILITPMHSVLKTLILLSATILGIAFYSRLYLISFISSIIDVKKSYLSLNTFFWCSHRKTIVLLTLISLTPILIGLSILSLMSVDLETALESVDQIAYLSLVMNFFILPFEASASMYVLKDLEAHEEEVEGVINEEVA